MTASPAEDACRRVAELRELIVRSAPDPQQASPVRTCPADAPLDGVIPFSSLIVLGTVVADGLGNAELTVNLPAGSEGTEVVLQAAEAGLTTNWIIDTVM